jgi:hypothetical protein
VVERETQDVLLPMPRELWKRSKVAATEEGRPVKELVWNALRVYLTTGRRAPDGVNLETGDIVEPTRTGKPGKAALQALIDAVPARRAVAAEVEEAPGSGPRVVAVTRPDLRGLSPRQRAVEVERFKQYCLDHPEEVPQ